MLPPATPPRRWRAALVVTSALVAVACSAGGRSASTTTAVERSTTTSAPATDAPIGFRQITFIDTTRSTRPNPPASSTASRQLETLVFYPSSTPPGADAVENAPVARSGPFPLVVLAHGLSGFPAAYLTLLQSWARAGFVVAAPKFPLTNATTPGGTRIDDYNSQPGDVSFVITQLLADNADPTNPLAGSIDPSHIAAAGHSLGAMTVLGLRNTCCEDHRISADIVLAGMELVFDSKPFFPPPAIPILFIHGTNDRLVPYNNGRKAFADAPTPKFFVTLPGADHVFPYLGSPAAQPPARVVVDATIDFLDRYEKGDQGALGRLTKDATVAGVATIESSP